MRDKCIIILIVCFTILSCKTYTITPQSFKKQFIDIDSSALKTTKMNSAFPNVYGKINIKYLSNQLEKIYVEDKEGKIIMLKNSPSLEMRVTLKNNKKYHFYFDTVILQNDTLTGGRSRFISSIVRKIPFDSIIKIEIQDGQKRMKYSK